MTKNLRSSVLFCALAVTALPVTPAGAQSPTADAPNALYTEVVALLEGEVSENVILQWLGTQTERPTFTARQILLLRDAGASDRLLAALLGADPEALSEPESNPESKVESSVAPAIEATAPSTTAAATGGMTEVSFRLSARMELDSDDEPVAMYAYLNGKPLSYVPTNTLLNSREPVLFDRELPPGRHVLRVSLEHHEELEDGSALHRARFAPDALIFDLESGRPASVEVRYRQGLVEWGSPLSWSFQQGTIRDDRAEVGGDSDHWPSLCSEAEESERAGCTTWPALWELSDPEQEKTTREDVLRAMALFDYRPVPIDS